MSTAEIKVEKVVRLPGFTFNFKYGWGNHKIQADTRERFSMCESGFSGYCGKVDRSQTYTIVVSDTEPDRNRGQLRRKIHLYSDRTNGTIHRTTSEGYHLYDWMPVPACHHLFDVFGPGEHQVYVWLETEGEH